MEMLHIHLELLFEDYRKFSAGLKDRKTLTSPSHLSIVNQQIFIMKNVIWTMLVSTYEGAVSKSRED